MMTYDKQLSATFPRNGGAKIELEKRAYDCKCTYICIVRFQSLSPLFVYGYMDPYQLHKTVYWQADSHGKS